MFYKVSGVLFLVAHTRCMCDLSDGARGMSCVRPEELMMATRAANTRRYNYSIKCSDTRTQGKRYIIFGGRGHHC